MIHDVTARSSRFLRLSVTVIGIGIAVGLFIGMPACGDDETTAPNDDDGPFTGTIQVLDDRFSPRNVTISAADSIIVTWIWAGSNSHTVTHGTGPTNLGGLFDTPEQSSGTFVYQFTTAGTYPYFCRPHFAMGMTGTITVEP